MLRNLLPEQTYIINSAKVMFLNPKASGSKKDAAADACRTCHGSLREGAVYCSLACKVSGGMAWRYSGALAPLGVR